MNKTEKSKLVDTLIKNGFTPERAEEIRKLIAKGAKLEQFIMSPENAAIYHGDIDGDFNY